jgi:hypothetical protein
MKNATRHPIAAGLGALVLLAILIGGAVALDQTAQAKGIEAFLYNVKFTCVPEVGPTDATDRPFEPADYRTAINIFNFDVVPVSLAVRGVVAQRANIPPLPAHGPVNLNIAAGQAVDITCADIASLVGDDQPVGNGFITFESPEELEVVAVYTAKIVDVRTQNQAAVFFEEVFPGTFTVPVALRLPDAVRVDPESNEPAKDFGGAIQPVRSHFSEFDGSIFKGSSGGLGLGVGAGVSVDVEYIVARIVMRPPGGFTR